MNELKENVVKNRTYYFFDDINISILIQIKSRQIKINIKIFLFATLDT